MAEEKELSTATPEKKEWFVVNTVTGYEYKSIVL